MVEMTGNDPFIACVPGTHDAICRPSHEMVGDAAEQIYYEESDCSEDSEDTPEIDDVVREDMGRLESIFHDMGFKFRMIDRIGEG